MARRFAEQSFKIGSLDITYVEGPPSGPALVLLHGFAARWQFFMPVLPALSERWHVFAPDFRGHGASGWTPGEYRIERLIDDTQTFLETHVGEPAAIFGHSLGGWVAAAIAAATPHLVRGLVIGDSELRPARQNGSLSLSYLQDAPIALRGMSTSLNQLDPEAMAMFRDARMTDGMDPSMLLPRISCPVLLLQGNPTLGALMVDADVERARSLLTRVKHVRIEKAGHGLHVQDPDSVLDAVMTFLETL
jgi:pimeloyl-ACP methyl ester carboxylesterase